MKRFLIKNVARALCPVVAVALWTAPAFAAAADNLAPGVTIVDQQTLRGEKNFLTGYEPVGADGLVSALVEIPAGMSDKWEVRIPEGIMVWDQLDGKPRVVKYLAYPVNYGIVPGTVLAKELGGDGDPLDILLLGPAYKRGQVVKTKVIGLMKMFDKGERDDKLVVVAPDGPFGEIGGIAELDRKFPGVTRILETWFQNYKGPGKTSTHGFAEADEARKLLDETIEAFKKQTGKK